MLPGGSLYAKWYPLHPGYLLVWYIQRVEGTVPRPYPAERTIIFPGKTLTVPLAFDAAWSLTVASPVESHVTIGQLGDIYGSISDGYTTGETYMECSRCTYHWCSVHCNDLASQSWYISYPRLPSISRRILTWNDDIVIVSCYTSEIGQTLGLNKRWLRNALPPPILTSNTRCVIFVRVLPLEFSVYNFPGKNYAEFNGWLKKAFNNTINTYNYVQLNSWMKKYSKTKNVIYDLEPIELQRE